MLGTKILFLEDNIIYQESIKEYLEDEKFFVETCGNGEEFLDKIFDNIYDLYIIDINVPIINGIDLMKMLQEYKDTTMKLVLTSYSNNVLSSFQNGCDEFVNKSSDVEEIMLRIKTLLKRAYHSHSETIKIKDDINYNLFTKQLYKDKKHINLKSHAQLILDYLIKNRGEYITSNELERRTYPCNTESKSSVIRYHICNLRNTLGKDIIDSKKNLGYKLNS